MNGEEIVPCALFLRPTLHEAGRKTNKIKKQELRYRDLKWILFGVAETLVVFFFVLCVGADIVYFTLLVIDTSRDCMYQIFPEDESNNKEK